MSALFNYLTEENIRRLDYDGNHNVIYAGVAEPGTAASAAGWAIQRYTYTAGDLTLVEWAGGTRRMGSIWDNRAGLAYS